MFLLHYYGWLRENNVLLVLCFWTTKLAFKSASDVNYCAVCLLAPEIGHAVTWCVSVLALGNDFLKELSVRKPNVLFDTDAALSSCIISLSQFPLLEKGHFSSSQAVLSQHLARGNGKKDRGICQEQTRERWGKEDENSFLSLLRCP